MSATKTVGAYEISNIISFDPDENLYQVKMGVKSKKGLIIHYTVHGKSPTIAENRAKFIAKLLTNLKSDTMEYPWDTYDGAYEKEYYDVKLVTGEIVLNCYPNAGTFHVLKANGKYAEGCVIEGNVVAEYRLSLFDPFKREE